jgi:hypothetical protein
VRSDVLIAISEILLVGYNDKLLCRYNTNVSVKPVASFFEMEIQGVSILQTVAL